MFDTEEKISKNITGLNGEDEFQIRYIRDEEAGIVTTRSDKSYFLLDSKDYWYDLIQEQYPGKQKCSCKNDFFKIRFEYVPRKGTQDFRSVEIFSECTECGKIKKVAQIDIDYSPSAQLLEQPITFCEQPKIKYKTYSITGFWSKEDLNILTKYLSDKHLLIYLWCWNKDNKREFNRVSFSELSDILSDEEAKYLGIYFSTEPLEEVVNFSVCDELGIYVDRTLWRKNEIVKIDAPITILSENGGELYYMDFCSEYIDSDGKVKAKSENFCKITKDLLKYSQEKLKR